MALEFARIIVHGRGAHGSRPQASIDPVVLAAMIVVRLQTVISREVQPGEPAILTVGSIQAGTNSNVIPDHAVVALNVRSTTTAPVRRSLMRSVGSSPPNAKRRAARDHRSSSCLTTFPSPTTTGR